MDDQYGLDRFLRAQDPIYDAVLGELRRGRKTSHWMWFIFPQIRGLGRTPTSELYAIASLGEARAFLGHPVLGARLRLCTDVVTSHEGLTAEQIFGHPDWLKFRSSMTLFSRATEDRTPFEHALSKYFGNKPDARTLSLLER